MLEYEYRNKPIEKAGTMLNPVAPTVSHESTKPEDVQAWSDYYAACERWVDDNKPGMRDRF